MRFVLINRSFALIIGRCQLKIQHHLGMIIGFFCYISRFLYTSNEDANSSSIWGKVSWYYEAGGFIIDFETDNNLLSQLQKAKVLLFFKKTLQYPPSTLRLAISIWTFNSEGEC